MSLVRHIAGIPTPTEQRCIRCCQVIRRWGALALWPGEPALMTGRRLRSAMFVAIGNERITDCTPHDPHLIDDLKPEIKESLAELERAR